MLSLSVTLLPGMMVQGGGMFTPPLAYDRPFLKPKKLVVQPRLQQNRSIATWENFALGPKERRTFLLQVRVQPTVRDGDILTFAASMSFGTWGTQVISHCPSQSATQVAKVTARARHQIHSGRSPQPGTK